MLKKNGNFTMNEENVVVGRSNKDVLECIRHTAKELLLHKVSKNCREDVCRKDFFRLV